MLPNGARKATDASRAAPSAPPRGAHDPIEQDVQPVRQVQPDENGEDQTAV